MAPDIKSPEPYSTLNACIHDYLRLWMPESCFKRSFFSKRNPFIWSTQHRDSHFKCQPPMPVTVVLVLVLGICSKLKKNKKRCLYLVPKQNSKDIVLHELCKIFPSRIIWRSKIYGIHHFLNACIHDYLTLWMSKSCTKQSFFSKRNQCSQPNIGTDISNVNMHAGLTVLVLGIFSN